MANNNNGWQPRPNLQSVPKQYQDSTFNRAGMGDLSWNSIETDAVAFLVQAGTMNGNCLILSTTTDGGALAVTYINGNQRVRDYPRSSEQVREFAQHLVDTYS